MATPVGTVDPKSDAPDGTVVQAVTESPGSLLREAREAKKLSCHEVAAYLRLTSSVIEMLERDDYSKFSGATFVRGYLRGYARYIGLPTERVLEAYERLSIPEPAHPVVKTQVRKQLRSNDRWVRAVTYIVVVLVITLPLLWWKHEIALRLWHPEDPVAGHVQSPMAESQPPNDGAEAQTTLPEQITYNPTQPSAQPDTASTTAGASGSATGAGDSAQPNQESGTGVAVPGDASVRSAAVEARETGAAVAASAAQMTSSKPVNPPQEQEPPATDEQDALVLRFAEDSWVEIKGGDGKRLLNGLIQAGDTRTVNGKPPFSLVLGNAPGVSVEFNGQPFDLSPFRRGKVARFAIGSPEPRSD